MYKGLLVRPRPIEDETPGSLLMRAAHENGFTTIIQMAFLCGYNFFDQNYRAALIKISTYKKILQALNLKMIDVAKTMGRTGLSARSGRMLGSYSFPGRFFHDDCSHYCPSCLSEKPYWRRLWLFKPYSSCHKHGHDLIDHCPSCTKPLVITRGCIYKCSHCQFDLRKIKEDAKVREASQWIHNIIERDSSINALEFIEMYDALKQFAVNRNIDNCDEFAVRILHLYFANKNEAVELMIAELQKGTGHPRLQLLPLLTTEDFASKFAYITLKEIDAPLTNLTSTDNETTLSFGEATSLIGISARTLTKWTAKAIKNGIKVEFPASVELLIKMKDEFFHDRSNEHQVELTDEKLTINQTAEMLNVHPEIVRSLQHKGYLKFEKQNVGGSLKAVTTPAELEIFSSQFVLVGTLARKFGVNATDLTAKLRSLGIMPIAGPAINKLKTSLFQQKDIENVTKLQLDSIEKCETNAGRKKIGSQPPPEKPSNSEEISIVDAAKELDITLQKAKTLIQKGVLEKTNGSQNGVILTKSSLKKLKSIIENEEYISVENAATALNTSLNLMKRNWVNTGFLDIIDCYFWRFVSKIQVAEVIKIKEEYVDSAEGGRLLGVNRSHLINQHRIGNLSCTVIAGKKLFKISDVLALSIKNRESVI